MDVYIEFTKPEKFSFFSWLICLIERTEYSHVRLKWTTNIGKTLIFEADGLSVRFIGPEAQKELKSVIIHAYKVELTSVQYMDLINLCMKYAGIYYGYKQLIGIGIARLLNLSYNPLGDGAKTQVCSELVGRFLQDILKIGRHLNLDIVGPKDIKEVLDNNYNIWRK